MMKWIKLTIVTGIVLGMGVLLWVYNDLTAGMQTSASQKKEFRSYASYTLEDIFSESGAKKLAGAAARGDVGQIEKLAAAGTSVNSLGINRFTPLYWAIRNENRRGYEKLLELGADPNVTFDKGSSVMHMAAGMKDSTFLVHALKNKGNPNLIDKWSGETPVFEIGPFCECYENLDLLLKAGADPNFRIEFNRTPISSAAVVKDYELVWRLIEAGAEWRPEKPEDDNVVDSMIRFPLDESFPQYSWYKKVKDFLTQKGVDFSITPTPVRRSQQESPVKNVTGYSDTLAGLFPSTENPHWRERESVNRQLEILLKGRAAGQELLLDSIGKEPGKFNPLVLIAAGIRFENEGRLHDAFVFWNTGVIRAFTDMKIVKDKTVGQGLMVFQAGMDFDAKEKFTEKALGGKEAMKKAKEALERTLKENPAVYERHWAAGHGIDFDPKAEPSSYMLPEFEWKKMDEENLNGLMKSYE